MKTKVLSRKVAEIIEDMRIRVEYIKELPCFGNDSMCGADEEHIHKIIIHATYLHPETDQEIEVATILIDEIEISEISGEYLDGISGDYGAIAEALGFFTMFEKNNCFSCGKYKNLYNRMKQCLEYNNLYYINRFIVNPKFRGYGIGRALIKELHKILPTIIFADNFVLALNAAPIEINHQKEPELYEKYRKKLYKFYEDCGFTYLEGQVFLKIISG